MFPPQRLLRHLRAALLGLLCLVFASSAQALPFDIDCGGAANVDTDPATLVGCTVATSGTVTDLDVYLNIDDGPGNPYATDLQVTLVHVATGTSVSLFVGSEVVNPQSVMDATFDDSAAGAPPGSGDIIGSFLPVELLSAFNGLELSGDWRLEILDQSAFPDEGIDLFSWHLVGTFIPEPGTGLLLFVGLLGAALPTRRA